MAEWPVGCGESAEPDVLAAHFGELLAAYLALRVLTGDAFFCQWSLSRAIAASGRDDLLADKDVQPNLLEASRAAFAGPGGFVAQPLDG